jgi:hypothetical protein
MAPKSKLWETSLLSQHAHNDLIMVHKERFLDRSTWFQELITGDLWQLHQLTSDALW